MAAGVPTGAVPIPPPKPDIQAIRREAATILRRTLMALPLVPVDTRDMKVARGDTLMNLLVKAGAATQDAHDAILALKTVYSPRDLMPGQEIQVGFAEGTASDAPGALQLVTLRPSLEEDIRVARNGDGGFVAGVLARPLTKIGVTATGTIETSLSQAASEVPANTLNEAIQIFSFDVDFQRELQKGDTFEFFYETYLDEEGRLAKTGPLLYASLNLSGDRLELYRFDGDDGPAGYYSPSGESARRTLMRTPIDGARLSSGYGMRRHPVLGYSKMHRGIDFAAPRGTPIYAAGNGVIESAGRNGAYGRYIRIRHNSTFKTAYAHMHRIAKGMHRGRRVKQGQIIGYVGSSGRSTGPHLHYEVIRNGRQTNPLKVKLPSGKKLSAEALLAFAETRDAIDRLRRQVGATQVVDADCRLRPRSPRQRRAGRC